MKKSSPVKHWTFTKGQLSSDQYETIKNLPLSEQHEILDAMADQTEQTYKEEVPGLIWT